MYDRFSNPQAAGARVVLGAGSAVRGRSGSRHGSSRVPRRRRSYPEMGPTEHVMPKQRRAPRRKTAETRLIEQVLRKALPDAQVEAYRHNSVSIRVRVISPRFRKLDRVKREELVYSVLET